MLPRVDLPDLIMEVHGWTGCLDAYTHLSEAEARMSELPTSVAACLLAEACNVGFAPIIQPGHPALGRARLSHVNQNYLRAENHRAANACLIDAQAGIDLVAQWGTGQLASVDGLRFVVPPASVRASANPRYFGQRGKGVTWLNYVNDQVAGLGGIVVTGTIRDSLHVLDGLLDLDGGTRPELVATDTASYSDQVFGLFALLGYQFSPRLADMPDQKFWRINPDADYGRLNALVPDRKHLLDLDLIRRNWPDILRVIGSLSTGAIQASELMRVTQGGGTPTTLAGRWPSTGVSPRPCTCSPSSTSTRPTGAASTCSSTLRNPATPWRGPRSAARRGLSRPRRTRGPAFPARVATRELPRPLRLHQQPTGPATAPARSQRTRRRGHLTGVSEGILPRDDH
jgi:TnpA family transposase